MHALLFVLRHFCGHQHASCVTSICSLLSLHSSLARLLESLISLKIIENPGEKLEESWLAFLAALLQQSFISLLSPSWLSSYPVYFQQKAGGAQTNRKQGDFWLSSKSTEFWPAWTEETAWQGVCRTAKQSHRDVCRRSEPRRLNCCFSKDAAASSGRKHPRQRKTGFMYFSVPQPALKEM